jgi:hypothetical protein
LARSPPAVRTSGDWLSFGLDKQVYRITIIVNGTRGDRRLDGQPRRRKQLPARQRLALPLPLCGFLKWADRQDDSPEGLVEDDRRHQVPRRQGAKDALISGDVRRTLPV